MLGSDPGADAGSAVRMGTAGTQRLTAPSETTQGCLFVKPFPSAAKILRDGPAFEDGRRAASFWAGSSSLEFAGLWGSG